MRKDCRFYDLEPLQWRTSKQRRLGTLLITGYELNGCFLRVVRRASAGPPRTRAGPRGVQGPPLLGVALKQDVTAQGCRIDGFSYSIITACNCGTARSN